MARFRTLLLPAALLLVVLAAFSLWSRGGEDEPAAIVVEAIEAGAPVLDVRTAREFATGHVAGARNANVLDGDFRQRVDDLARDQTVYVYCASGHRSGRAASVLEEMGFERVVNAGGIGALRAAGAEIEASS